MRGCAISSRNIELPGSKDPFASRKDTDPLPFGLYGAAHITLGAHPLIIACTAAHIGRLRVRAYSGSALKQVGAIVSASRRTEPSKEAMSIASHTAVNSLLAGLPASSLKNVLHSCEQVQLKFAQVLGQPNERIRHVYFPIEGFVSMVAVLEDGGHLRVGIVGNEGMIGASLALGVNSSSDRAIVQREGVALRMPADVFGRQCASSRALRVIVNRYLHVSMAQLAQLAACTGYHMVEARLARWLLTSRDRAQSDDFYVTHELLAYMLGVRRVGVTQAAAALQARGLIAYRRGHITIVDGEGLGQASCGCYERQNAIYEATMTARVKSKSEQRLRAPRIAARR
jgi:CRP-like cAMP-binding protein